MPERHQHHANCPRDPARFRRPTPPILPGWACAPARAALCGVLVAASGCGWLGIGRDRTGELPVTVTFENVRTFDAESAPDRASEWDLISPRVRRYHVEGNALGIVYAENPRQAGRASASTTMTDYQVRMVVRDAKALMKLQRDLAALDGRRVGTARGDLVPKSVTLAYASPYVSADLEFTIYGRAEPGAEVLVYDHAGEPRSATADRSGSWRLPVRIDPDRDFLYGRSTPPGATRAKHFRINVFTRDQEEISERQFERGRG